MTDVKRFVAPVEGRSSTRELCPSPQRFTLSHPTSAARVSISHLCQERSYASLPICSAAVFIFLSRTAWTAIVAPGLTRRLFRFGSVMGHSRSQDPDILLEGSRGHVLALFNSQTNGQPDRNSCSKNALSNRVALAVHWKCYRDEQSRGHKLNQPRAADQWRGGFPSNCRGEIGHFLSPAKAWGINP